VVETKFRILPAHDYYEAALLGNLSDGDICLTFDDSLLCQYEIAAPILADSDLTAFFFVYSSAFTNQPDPLEIYRYFRSTEFSDFDHFFREFLAQAQALYETQISGALQGFDPDSYLSEFPFYSTNDRLFRYVRDDVLSDAEYDSVMAELMLNRGFEVGKVIPLLYMNSNHLTHLHDRGNVIGLHSHTHPTRMDTLSLTDQQNEYATNRAFLSEIIGDFPTSMSHPCGRYTADTLELLTNLGVRLGFRSSLSVPETRSLLEIPREDHANVMSKVRS
jgi:peptidoglycan/xylan/chitin deacetylase (PgdA/CDA1 family)